MTKRTSERCVAVLEFIRVYVRLHGYSPTYREIGCWFNVSPVSIGNYIRLMERDGCIIRAAGKTRTAFVVGEKGGVAPRIPDAVADLTEDQAMVYHFVRMKILDSGIPPSLWEIARYMGWTTPSRSYAILIDLERLRLIRRVIGKNRAITLMKG